MRCDHCPYLHTVAYEDDYETCMVFGDNDDYYWENAKGELGCKYNLKTLNKIYKQEREIEDKAVLEYMAGFVKFCEEEGLT